MDTQQVNKPADGLIEAIKQHFQMVEGKTLTSKEILKVATDVIKRRLA